MSEIQSIATNNYILQAPPPTATMFTTELEYDGDKISGYAGSAFKAGTDLEFGYTDADTISSINNSALTDVSLNNIVQTNSGVWGGSALPISAGPGIDVQLENNILVFSAVPNETVIYTNIVPSNTLVFSEPCTNFERIRLELSSYQETTTCNYYEIKPNADKLTYFSNTFVSNATYPLQILGCQFTGTDGITYTNTTAVRVCFSTESDHTVGSYGTQGSSIETDSNRDAGFITKVIGINRIAGGD
jgi:hypothetical protein